jgi:hypothetical protein
MIPATVADVLRTLLFIANSLLVGRCILVVWNTPSSSIRYRVAGLCIIALASTTGASQRWHEDSTLGLPLLVIGVAVATLGMFRERQDDHGRRGD